MCVALALYVTRACSDFVYLMSSCFHTAATLSALNPTTGSVVGGVIVTLTGTDFLPNSAMECSIDAVDSAATYITTSTVKCVVPSRGSPAVASVLLRVNGVDETNALSFTYMGTVTVTSFVPTTGPTGAISLRLSVFLYVFAECM